MRKAGRPLGSGNKSVLSLIAKCTEKGIDPFNRLLILADKANRDSDYYLEFAALKEICSYLYPKRTAVNHTVDPVIESRMKELQDMSDEEVKAKAIELLENG